MNHTSTHPHPATIGLLTLPYGIALGWVIHTLSFTLVLHGFFPVPATMVGALGLSLYSWRILSAPFVDLGFSLRRWYLIGLAISIGGILPFFWLPAEQEMKQLMEFLVAVSQLGALLMLLAVMGFMAGRISADKMGRAAGWYQAAIIGGQGLAFIGSYALSGGVSWKTILLAELLLMSVGACFVYLLPGGSAEKKAPVKVTLAQALFDGRSWLLSSKGIFICLMALSPIGIGAASLGWYGGTELYGIPPDEARLVAGPLNMVCSVAGFLVGGWASDRYGSWSTWLRAGGALALMALLIAFCPFITRLFEAGLLCYAFLSAVCTAAFWTIIMQAVSPVLAVTKIVLLSMLIDISYHYMGAFDGWLADDFSFQWMLIGEALLSFLCIGIALLLRRRLGIFAGFTTPFLFLLILVTSCSSPASHPVAKKADTVNSPLQKVIILHDENAVNLRLSYTRRISTDSVKEYLVLATYKGEKIGFELFMTPGGMSLAKLISIGKPSDNFLRFLQETYHQEVDKASYFADTVKVDCLSMGAYVDSLRKNAQGDYITTEQNKLFFESNDPRWAAECYLDINTADHWIEWDEIESDYEPKIIRALSKVH